jgi:hypothetical protein
VTTLVEERSDARIHELLDGLREVEADLRRSYARVLSVVAELDSEKAGLLRDSVPPRVCWQGC